MTIPIFPTLRGSFVAGRKPIWSTQREKAFSGYEARFPNWSYPQYQYSLKFEFLRGDAAETDWQTLTGFYNQLFGGSNLFQYSFLEDGGSLAPTAAQLIGTGDGAATTFQLLRTLGGFTEPVFAVTSISPTPQFFVNGVQIMPGHYTIDDYGMLTLETPPPLGQSVTWSGMFNWYCRFDDDSEDFERFARQYWDLKTLTFTTQKVRGDAPP